MVGGAGESYDFGREGRDASGELERLRAQVELTWSTELRHFRHLGVVDDGRVLETGCGPGYVLERWRDAFPGAELHGLDRDSRLLDLGRSGPVGKHVRWLEGDAGATGLQEATYDVVLARYLWQHLDDPGGAAAEARRVLCPGGRVIVVDVDAELWGVAQPTFPEVIPIHVKHGRAQGARGGDRRVGRRLWRILQRAGFQDVHLDVLAVHSDAVGLDPFLPQLDPDRHLVARRDGAISDEDLAVLRSAHRRFLESPDAYVMMLICVATGTRPLS